MKKENNSKVQVKDLSGLKFILVPLFLISIWITSCFATPSVAKTKLDGFKNTPANDVLWANGPIYSSDIGSDGTVYFGGIFTKVGPFTGNAVPINESTGLINGVYPKVNGPVNAIVADGSGGWYIGGAFSKVSNVTRNNLAHILSNGTLDSTWNPNVGGTRVSTIVLTANTVYFAGYFSTVGGQTRNNIAAVSRTTGTATSWNPNSSDQIATLVISGSNVYVGGSFTTIGGESRHYLAAVDITTGLATAWNPNPTGGTISKIDVNAGTVYVCGYFTNIGGAARNYLAAIDAVTGLDTGWSPGASYYVRSIQVVGSLIYATGDFTTIGGQSRSRIAALNLSDALATTWNPGADGTVQEINVVGSVAYVGGLFITAGGSSRNALAAIDTTTGVATTWDPGCNYGVNAIEVSGTTVYIGGVFSSVGIQTRNMLAAVDGTTNAVTSWNPNVTNGVVYAIKVIGSSVYVGGTFTDIAGSTRNRIAEINASTGAVGTWNPGMSDAVYSLEAVGSKLYVGGYFYNTLPDTGYGAPFNPSSKFPLATYPRVNGDVKTAVSDGSGGWFVGGTFSSVGGVTRNNLAHILSDGTLDPSWNPAPNNTVSALKLSGSTLYLGGSFTTVSSVTHNRIAAVDASTGVATAWTPAANGAVSGIDVSGSNIYIVGGFTTAGGATRYYAAALDATTGSATSWNPYLNNTGNTVKVVGSTIYIGGNFTYMGAPNSFGAPVDATTGIPVATFPVVNNTINAVASDGAGGWYIGGSFTTVGGTTRNRIAHILSDGSLDPTWNPNSGGTVQTICVSGSTIYAGGSFTSIGGATRNRIAALNNTTGLATGWDPNAGSTVNVIKVEGSTVYVGGQFTSIGGATRNRIAALNITTGLATTWDPNSLSTVSAIEVSGSIVYVGGAFTTIGGATRNRIAALNVSDGLATSWNPNAGNSVATLKVDGSTVYVGGSFTTIGGATRNRIAALNVSDGLATSWNPGANGAVSSLKIVGSTIYAVGAFTTIGGQSRAYGAALDMSTGTPTAFNIEASASANMIDVSGSNAYVGGTFTTIGGATRGRVAAVNNTTGVASSWNPSANQTVYSVESDGSAIYVGGAFTTIGGQSRTNLAAIDPATGLATAWNASVSSSSGYVNSIRISGSTMFIGGSFYAAGGQNRYCAASLDISTALATTWNPYPNGIVNIIEPDGTNIYVGGAFTSIGRVEQAAAMAFDLPSIYPSSWNPSHQFGVKVYALEAAGSTMYMGGDFTNVGGATRNRIAAVNATTGAVSDWSPAISGGNNVVKTIKVSSNTVYVGGDFITAGGLSRRYLASIDSITGNVTSWDPYMDNPVTTMDIVDSMVYAGGSFTTTGAYTGSGAPIDPTTGGIESPYPQVNNIVKSVVSDGAGGWYIGGSFTQVGSFARDRLAHIFADGTVDPDWNPGANDYVFKMIKVGTTLYVGGQFTTIGGQSRSSLAALNASTGELLSFDAGTIVGNVIYGDYDGSTSTLYIGGNFTTINGQGRKALAAVDGTTGALKSWDPNATPGSISGMSLIGDNIYVGGWFSTIGGQSRSYAAAVDKTTGLATSWNPSVNDVISKVFVDGDTAYVTGNFTSFGGQLRNRLASFDINTGTVTSWNPNANAVVYDIVISGSTAYLGGAFTTIGGQSRSYAAAVDKTTGSLLPWYPIANNVVEDIDLYGSMFYMGGQFTSIARSQRNYVASYKELEGTLTGWTPESATAVTDIMAGNSALYVAGSYIPSEGGVTYYYLAKFEEDWEPSLAINAITPDPTSDSTPSLTGTSTDDYDTVEKVEFILDDTSGTWSDCTADDGAFDEISEAFTCTPSTAVPDGAHIMYVRTTDSLSNTTDPGEEESDSFTIDTTPPVITLGAYDPEYYVNPTLLGLVTDETTIVAGVEYQVDGGSWKSAASSDGAFDEGTESYIIATSGLGFGDHVINVRATDSVGNTSVNSTYRFKKLDLAAEVGRASIIYAQPTITEVGNKITINVTVRYANGNPIPGAKVILAVAGSSGLKLTQPVELTDANGLAIGSLTSQVEGFGIITARVQIWGYDIPLYMGANVSFSAVKIPVISEMPAYTKGTSNTINWSQYGENYEYYLEVATDESFTNIVKNTGWVSDTSYTAADLADGQTYFYRVKARNQFNLESAWSQVASSMQDNTDPVSSISGIKQKDGKLTISLTGSDSASGIDYILVFMKKDDGSWVEISHTSSLSFVTDTLEPGHYCFYSQSVDKSGNIEDTREGGSGDMCVTVSKGIGSIIPGFGSSVSKAYTGVSNFVKAKENQNVVTGLESVPLVTTAVSTGAVIGLSLLDLPIYLRQLFLWFLGLIGIRSKRYPWGIVYNSVTKAPLARSVVRLFKGEKLIDTSVTDVNGVFAFTPTTGTYTLTASAPGFVFPSNVVTVSTDGQYSNIYRGGQYSCTSEKEVVKISIPLDPVEFGKSFSSLRRFGSLVVDFLVKLNPVILILGIALSLIAYMQTHLPGHMIFLLINSALLVLHCYARIISRDKWGTVTDLNGNPVSGVEVGIFDRKYGRLVDYRITDDKGRFLFILPGDLYTLRVLSKNCLIVGRNYVDGFPVGRKDKGSIRISPRVKIRMLKAVEV